ncbi:MAG: Maf family protein [Gammaproteobacteria bacterium]
MKPYNIVLASSSKYRQNLLAKLNLKFSAASPNIDEAPLSLETPEQTSRRLSESKAKALQAQYPHHLIIGSDQVAVIGDRQLGKPGDKEHAIEQLKAASAHFITFFTSVCVLNSETGQIITETDLCKVFFKTLSTEQIEHYLNIEHPYDCAGAFKSEGLGIALFTRIESDDPNALVGLPLIKLLRILEKFGVRVI